MRRKTLPLIILCLFITACGDSQPKKQWHTSSEVQSTVSPGTTELATLTIGDIDPDTPTNRMRKIKPLANLIARKLNWEKSRVKIQIARSIGELSLMINENRVDLYIDSSYPSTLVKRATGSKIILESLVDGNRSYYSILIAKAESGVTTLSDLVGKKFVFQEQYSTSGYLLPASLLLNQGLSLKKISGQYDSVTKEKVAYFFSADEENTFTMIRKGIVAAGAIASTDYQKLTPELKAEFRVLAKTPSVPRKLASTRSGLDPVLNKKLIEVLLSINDEDRKKMREQHGWNWQFIELDAKSQKGLAHIDDMIDTIDILASN